MGRRISVRAPGPPDHQRASVQDKEGYADGFGLKSKAS